MARRNLSCLGVGCSQSAPTTPSRKGQAKPKFCQWCAHRAPPPNVLPGARCSQSALATPSRNGQAKPKCLGVGCSQSAPTTPSRNGQAKPKFCQWCAQRAPPPDVLPGARCSESALTTPSRNRPGESKFCHLILPPGAFPTSHSQCHSCRISSSSTMCSYIV